MKKEKDESANAPRPRGAAHLQPGDYYYNEQGFLVFTAQYHLRRGYCCRSGCRHCPYGFKPN
nr:DUF5522 domain-containing protein [Catalinimonas alkaloidigena]